VAAIEPPPETAIGGDLVRFDSSDGVQLVGHVFHPAAGTPVTGAILFVHEPFRSARDWVYMADKMTRFGFVSLIFDLRGHGQSLMQGDEELDREMFGNDDFAAMTMDLQAAVKVLREQAGTEQVHLAGSDLGGSLCILHAQGDAEVTSVALLSPGLGYDGINLKGQILEYGKRPLLMVYSVEDGYARKSVEVFGDEAVGPTHIETYYGVGHGTKMLAREPQLEVLMTGWFLGTVITSEGRAFEDAGKPITTEKEAAGGELDAEEERRRLQEDRESAEREEARAIEDDQDEGRGRRWELEDERRK
jgi:pimeloyl-ACP methyl ester carboxylesterase